MDILEKINRFPPKAVRLTARKPGGYYPLSSRDIAKLSGISKSRVDDISKMDKWDALPISTIAKFCKACGCDPLNPGSQLRMMRNRKMVHLIHGDVTQRRLFSKLLAA